MIKVLELYAGLGAYSKALERLGIPFKVVDAVEIDSYAIKAYNAIHKTNFEPQDIAAWDKDIEVDMICHSSPCTNISIAGRGEGADKDSGTSSSLIYESIRIIEKLKPKYVVFENVKNIISKKHKHNFYNYLESLENAGYSNYYRVMDSQDYGVPQHRERLFCVSIRNDVGLNYEFPPVQTLHKKLKDVLEKDVLDKYYLSDAMINYLKSRMPTGKNKITTGINIYNQYYDGVAGTVCAGAGHKPSDNFICDDFHTYDKRQGKIIRVDIPQTVRLRKYPVDVKKLQEVLRSNKNHTNKEIACILDKPLTLVEHWFRTDNCFAIPDEDVWYKLKALLSIETDEFDESITTFEEREGVYEKANRCYFEDGIAPTITCVSTNEKIIVNEAHELRIRKLTPLETWRLMNFDDIDFYLAKTQNISDTQLIKLSGNSVVVSCLESIFRTLLNVEQLKEVS